MNITRTIQKGEIYRHFKGNLYQIVSVAVHSETNEPYVVYQALYGDMQVWVRPYASFVSEVDKVKYPQATQKYRFEAVSTLAGGVVQAGVPGYGAAQAQPGMQGYGATQMQPGAPGYGVVQAQPGMPGYGAAPAQQGAQNYGVVQPQPAMPDYTAVPHSEPAEDDEPEADKRLLAFLDTDTYKEKLNYLSFIKKDIDDRLINDIAVALDIMIEEGPVEERYSALVSCLQTMAKFECNRLR